jgi:NAD(P)-dependent dehydrogenase (short-subunit alcohol dehydrogenase family)
MNDGSVALVTNGAYGVGREIVRALDAIGLRVAPARASSTMGP